MDLLFVSPRWEKFKHWPFHMSLLGPLTVAGLTSDKHCLTYIDENVEDIDFDLRPDAVVISAMTVQAQRGYEIAEKFMDKGIPVIMGGLHATLLPEEVQQKVTVTAAGEGEILWPRIISDLERHSLNPLYVTNDRADLECGTFSLPRRDLLRKVGYTKTFAGQRVIDTIQAGRGCARNCPDCNVPLVSGRRFRPRLIDDILKEIDSIEASFLFFVDDGIPENTYFFKELFTAMKGMNKRWMSVGALHVVNDPDYLKLMVESGCRVFYIGFDRLDPRWRQQQARYSPHDFYRLDIKKYDISFKQDFLTHPQPFYDAIKCMREVGIALIGTFAFGFDVDDTSIFEKSVAFALESELNLADFNVVVPYPKSPLAIRLEREGRILTHDWKLYNGMHVVFQPKNMTPDQLLDGTEWAWNQWNKHRPIFRNMIQAFRELN